MTGKYFIDDPFKTLWPGGEYSFIKDEEGIIQINYPETNYRASGVRQQYHPTVISVYALSMFSTFLDTGDEQYKNIFLKYTDWLVDNLADGDGFSGWNFYFNWNAPGYKATSPFISSSIPLRKDSVVLIVVSDSFTSSNSQWELMLSTQSAFIMMGSFCPVGSFCTISVHAGQPFF